MYLILKDLKLSGLVPGQTHYEQVQIPNDHAEIRTRICRAGYEIVLSNDDKDSRLPVRDWRTLARIK